jgi:fatty-acyl-CoA synthase
LWTIIEQQRPQELYCIPAIWRRLLEHADGGDGRYLTRALTGTSRVEPDLIDKIRVRFPNARTGIFYGSTEVGVSLGISHEDILTHPYSIGMPMPNVEARLVDGELQLKSDTIMSEYFGLAKETNDVLQEGWYRSGDLATVDADGFYTIVGRRREVIRSGGETVAPAEVEAAIAAMRGIQDVAVIGLPDATWGEIVCAVIAVESEADAPSVEALRSHLSGHLASFKHPRRIEVSRSPLPRTPATGQLQRNRIKQEIMGLVAQNNAIDDT